MRRAPRPGIVFITVGITAIVFAAGLVAQDAMQLNVPYRCPDGATRTITRCQTTAQGDSCTWREERAGQPAAERTGTRAQMDAWLKSCAAPPAKSKPDSAAGTPTLEPPYLNGLPSVEKVIRDIHGAT